MEFTDKDREELFNDISKIEFFPGTLNDNYKYEAYIPKDIWNKWRPDKILKLPDHKLVKFGRPGYQQYHDIIGDWSSYNHNNKKRRENYQARHSAITLKDGRKSYLVPFTKEFFSYWFLW